MIGRSSVADPLFLTHSLQYTQYCATYTQYPVKMGTFENEPSTSFGHIQNVEVTPDINQFYGMKQNVKKEVSPESPSSDNYIPAMSIDLDTFSKLGSNNDLICKKCSHSFKNCKTLAQHVQKYHLEKLPSKPETEPTYNTKCKLCGTNCLSENDLKAHRCQQISTVKRHTCEYCNKSFSNSTYFGLHLKMHTEGSSHCCDICNKYFVNSSNYKIHLRTHDGEKPFKCVECDKGFLTSTNLSTHMRTHTGQRPFKCDHCNKTFINSSNLNIHRNYHKGLKSYHCKFCSKTFLTSSNLKVHVRIHTGEKPYRCFMCEKAFVTSSNLNLHIKSHKGTVNIDAGPP